MHKELYKEWFVEGAQWAQEQSPWISVKDALPDYDEQVLCINEYFGAFLNHRSNNPNVLTNEDGWCKIGVDMKLSEVQYWIPIPELPTNKTE